MSDAKPPAPDLGRLKIDRSPRRQRRRGPSWTMLLVLVAIVAGGWWWWRQRAAPTPTAAPTDEGPRLVTAELWQGDAGSSISANGYVIARRRAALSTVLSGRLVEITVEEGSRVTEGQVVARIQYDDYESSLVEAERALLAAQARKVQAEALVATRRVEIDQREADLKVAEEELESARTDLEEARRDRERNRLNFEKGVINEADWDRIKTRAQRLEDALDTTAARLASNRLAIQAARTALESAAVGVTITAREVEQAEAARDSAKVLLEKTYVRAPFSGVIVDKGAEEGEVVAATGAGGNSRGSVATLVDLDSLEVQIELPETRLGTVADDNPVEIYLDVEPARPWRGRVRQIWPKADRGKGTVEIRAVFLERPELLRPEMGARVVFLPAGLDRDGPRLVGVPATALRAEGDRSFIFLVKDGLLVRREVEVERRQGRLALIRSGLGAGDSVVDRPDRGLREGNRFSE